VFFSHFKSRNNTAEIYRVFLGEVVLDWLIIDIALYKAEEKILVLKTLTELI